MFEKINSLFFKRITHIDSKSPRIYIYIYIYIYTRSHSINQGNVYIYTECGNKIRNILV